jgi:hypothetical protein
MAEAVKQRRGRRGEENEATERQLLLEGMAQTRVLLNQAYAEFNVQSDPDLVESCVFAINALRSRYSYLIRKMKLLDEGKGALG